MFARRIANSLRHLTTIHRYLIDIQSNLGGSEQYICRLVQGKKGKIAQGLDPLVVG